MLKKSIGRFLANENGANVVEYAVLSCVVSVVLVSFAASGLSLTSAFERIAVILTHPADVAKAFREGD